MIAHVVRAITAHLESTLPALVASSAAALGVPAPVLGPVLTEYRDPAAAVDPFPETAAPAVVVSSGTATWSGALVDARLEDSVDVDVRWITPIARKEDAVNAVLVVVRALRQCLLAGVQPHTATAALSHGGVTIIGLKSMQYLITAQTQNVALTTGLVRIGVQVLDDPL